MEKIPDIIGFYDIPAFFPCFIFFHALLIREWLSLVEIKQFYSENVIIFGLDTVRNRFHPGCT